MKFDNYQKSSSLNVKAPNWWEIWKIQLFAKYIVLELCNRQGNGQFIRKGIVGDWMNHFTPELNKVLLNFISYCQILQVWIWLALSAQKKYSFIFSPSTGVQQLDQGELGQNWNHWWDCEIIFHTWRGVLKAGETKMQNASWLFHIHVFGIRFNICIFEMTSYKYKLESDKILYIFDFIFLNYTMAKQPLQNQTYFWHYCNYPIGQSMFESFFITIGTSW